MSHRSRFVVIAGATAGAAASAAGFRALQRARRRARLRQAGEGIAELLGPPGAAKSLWAPPASLADEAHAPGHQHLSMTAGVREQRAPEPVRERPFAKHRHGLRHPGRG